MNFSDLGVALFLILLILLSSFFGGYLDYTVNGVPVTGGDPFTDGVSFFLGMNTFQIDGAEGMSVFWLFLELMAGLLVVRFVRGQG